MNLKLTQAFFMLLIAFVALAGCEQAQKTVIGGMSGDKTTDESMSEGPAIPVIVVWFVDYPEGGKDAYIANVASNAETLQAPKEVVRIRSYDNVHLDGVDVGPDRLVEFEFNSFLDAARYMNRPEIAAILTDLPNYATEITVHTFIQRGDYTKDEMGDWPIRYISLIDYPLGEKEVYLEWVASIAVPLSTPPEVRAITSYDNYYGESPHRLVDLSFGSLEDYMAYNQLPEIMEIESQVETRSANWTSHVYALRSDYINE